MPQEPTGWTPVAPPASSAPGWTLVQPAPPEATPPPPTWTSAPGETFSEKIANAYHLLKNVAIGAGKSATNTALDLGQAAGHLPVGAVTGLPVAGTLRQQVDALYGTPGLSQTAFQQARQTYANTPQKVGAVAETIGELAIPVTEGTAAVKEALPSAERAGQVFQAVKAAAGSVPIDTSGPGNVALRIAEMAQHGGGTNWGPAPVRQFIQYVTDPKKPAMTYDVARDFASNISRLSSKDLASIPPSMQREIANLRVTLNQAVGEAAGRAGKGEEYASAMQEYARAMRLREALDDAIAGAKRYAPYLAAGSVAGGLGSYFGRTIASLWDGQ